MCSADLISFIRDNHLDLTIHEGEDYALEKDFAFDARAAFGSHDDADHTYNTPRAWFMLRFFNPHSALWDGPDADYGPEDDDLPWCLMPERKVTVEDVKYVLSAHYQGTPFDCYSKVDHPLKGKYRPIGINRNNFVALTQLRPYAKKDRMALMWIAEGSNVFNAFVPFYANVTKTPDYLNHAGTVPSTEEFYWANRLIGALADAHYARTASAIERYQKAVASAAHAMICDTDKKEAEGGVTAFLEQGQCRHGGYGKGKDRYLPRQGPLRSEHGHEKWLLPQRCLSRIVRIEKLLPAWIGRSFSIKDHIMEASFSFRIFKGIRLNRRGWCHRGSKEDSQ